MLATGPHLSGLWPPFRAVVQDYLLPWVAYYGLRGEVRSGFRSFDEQLRLYRLGRSQYQFNNRVRMRGENGAVTDAFPGESAHNYGLAIDVEGPSQREIVEVGKMLGFGTVSWDPAHLEWPNWRALAK